MKIIFATTNKRKISDLLKITKDLDIEILTLDDINYNLGEIEENGNTLEENSLIKAKTIYICFVKITILIIQLYLMMQDYLLKV